MMRNLAIASLLTLLPGAVSAAEQEGQCHLYKLASADLIFDNTGRVSVPMTIGDKTVNLMVDTGGSASTLKISTINALGLKLHQSHGYIKFYAGEVDTSYVTVHDALLAGLKAPELKFFVTSDVVWEEDGSLGADILRQFDIDFDFANGKFNVFSQDHCEGQVIWWTRPHEVVRVPFDRTPDGHIVISLLLDGKQIDSELDTGSAISEGSLEAVEDAFDIDEKNPSIKLLPGYSAHRHLYSYPFKQLSFDGVTVSNPELKLLPDRESGMWHHFHIGMNVLRHLHIYIAYEEHALYISSASAH